MIKFMNQQRLVSFGGILLILFCMLFAVGCEEDSVSTFQSYDVLGEWNLDIEKDELVTIDSEADFQRIFASYRETAGIDFSKSKLLIVKGVSQSGIQQIDNTIKEEKTRYIMHIRVQQNYTAVVQTWYIAYVVPKACPKTVTLALEYTF